MSDNFVICMKWGTLYSADYVNVLYRAVRDHLSLPHRFVCFTEDQRGIDPGVECYDLPDPHLDRAFTRMGGWPKLTIYQEHLEGLQGRALFIDLDSVVCGDLGPMLTHPGEVVVIREWRRFADYFRKWEVNGATGVLAFDMGGPCDHFYQTWLEGPEAHATELRSEQRFVTKYARDMQFWPDDWVVSFKRHLMAKPVLNRFVPVREPGPEAKIVAFHGKPRPIDVVADNNQVWGKPLRYGRGAVPFVRDYWIGYGGKDPS